ncbi:hypothetical protein ACFVXC_08825 [Streptomyces sp. NPDC058257]|uniref:hypothetical protein n=1 Tax=Streptomyces sp. NPDC058257 TaxID=3346409 RepID=UPI0036F14707
MTLAAAATNRAQASATEPEQTEAAASGCRRGFVRVRVAQVRFVRARVKQIRVEQIRVV